MTVVYYSDNVFPNTRILYAVVDQANVQKKHSLLFNKVKDITCSLTARLSLSTKDGHFKYYDTIDDAMQDSDKFDIVFIQSIGNFIKNAIEGKPIVIRGDGSAIRSYMFMGDLICWLLKLLLDGKSGEAYNVGSNKPISILELAHRVSQLSSTQSEVVVLGEAQYTVGVPVRDVYVPSIDKASNQLNLNVPTELRQSLIYTFNSIHK
jgi:hypothetical protein